MSEFVHCPKCDANNPIGAKTCAYCDASLPAVQAHETLPSIASVLDEMPGSTPSPPELADGPGFSARQPGARYLRSRFQVLEYLGAKDKKHLYCVSDSEWALRCVNHTCRLYGVRQTGDKPGLCPECAVPLESYQPQLLLQEADSSAHFGTAIEVAQRGVNHPALLAPLLYFEESDSSAVRCCLVMPEAPARYLSELEGKQDIVQVLKWGQRLGQGLLALHRFNILFDKVDAEHVAFVEAGPVWADFTAVRLLPGTSPLAGMAGQARDEFRKLARLLWRALSGLDNYDPSAPVAPRLHRLFAPWFDETSAPPDAHAWVQAIGSVAIQPTDDETAAQSLDLRSGRATSVGRVREINEDSMLVMEMSGNSRSFGRALGLYVVADGMGGHAAGEVASGLAISTLARRAQADLFAEAVFAHIAAEDIIAWLERAVAEVNEAVHTRREQARSNLGTTLVIAVVNGLEAYVANVGDSRAYRIDGGGITQLTTDHSLIEQLVASQHVTPEEARSHPQRSVIYKSIGERLDLEPDIRVVPLAPHDRLLVCSDGLNTMIADETIAQVVASHPAPQKAAAALIEAANEAGGTDNITAIVVEVAPV